MTVWKDSRGRWVSKFRFRNQQYKKEGFAKKSDAARWEAEKRRELEAPAAIRSISFHELSTRYLEWCRHRYQVNTWRAKSRYFRLFLAFLGRDRPAQEIERVEFLEYLDAVADESGPKTANRHHRDLKALYNWGIRADLTQSNPIRTIEPFGEDQFTRYIPPAEDVQRVFLVASGDDQDLLAVLLDTGARIGEVFGLQWDDVNLERREITLKTRKRKGGAVESDKLAMTDRLFRVLSARWGQRDKSAPWVFCDDNGRPWNYDRKRGMMPELCSRAGVQPFGFHSLRHFVASVLADSGKATLGQIQRFLRHRRQGTTEGYLHELDRGQREVAEILDGRTVPVGVPLFRENGGGKDREGSGNGE